MYLRITSLFLFLTLVSLSQNRFSCIVKDSLSRESLPGVTVYIEGTGLSAVSDKDGYLELNNIKDGEQVLFFSLMAYQKINKKIIFPLINNNETIVIFLKEGSADLEEVVVSTTRTNSRIDDLNTKVEVLGQEEMDEESSVIPGSIASILGDLSIITIQRTNSINGNEAIRMQGLDPRYTQLMRDGLPLYGGFSGSLGVLAIPPLDLKQVEIVKGSASTLYGGGAIGGLINFISKAPGDSSQTTVSFNATSLLEYNLNAFTSKKSGKLGLTLFGGSNIKTAYDVNKDGYAEIPEHKNVSLHPRMFYDFNKNNKLVLGLTTAYDTRLGGDLQAIRYRADSVHRFLQQEKSFRNTLDACYTVQINSKQFLTLKSAGSVFDRSLNYAGFIFNGSQYSAYSEVNDLIKFNKHTIVIGGNFMNEVFLKSYSDTVNFSNYNFNTIGFFLQEDWQLTEKISVQLGFRTDHHNKYGNFNLPRVSLFYKPSNSFSLRLASGTGYKVPNLFDFANPSNNLSDIQNYVNPEKSYGSNADLNFHKQIFGILQLQVNQAFYYTTINKPIFIATNAAGQKVLMNNSARVNSYGTDTYIRLSVDELELYLGYNHTESLIQSGNELVNMPFNPKDKFSTTVAYEVEEHWRMGIEASWIGNQFVYDNRKVTNFWFLAGMVERKFKKGSLVLNCENILDVRQSKYEKLVEGTVKNPIFSSIWGPVEGRVINLSVKVSL